MARPHFLDACLAGDPATFRLSVPDRGVDLAVTLEVAVDSAARRRGLLGREALPDGTALILAPCAAVHTFGMRFPIDVVFTSRDGRVVSIRSDVGRGRIAVSPTAFATVELPSGTAVRVGLAAGDRLAVVQSCPA